jgi:hypothetical protein
MKGKVFEARFVAFLGLQVALSEDINSNGIQYHGGYVTKSNATVYIIW